MICMLKAPWLDVWGGEVCKCNGVIIGEIGQVGSLQA